MEHKTLITEPSLGYALLDSGNEEKLERFGDVVLVRPDPQALWEKNRGSEWHSAQGTFVREGRDGKWQGALPKEWQIVFGGLQFLVKPTSFKHTGLFPEQRSNWEWISECISTTKPLSKKSSDLPSVPNSGTAGQTFSQEVLPSINILNVFGYTGGATLAAAAVGAKVTHVDASKTAVAWARENAKLSGLEDKPIRWITEDALTFVRREVSRGVKYDGIIMDPPAFGHGPDGEVWKFEEDFLKLLQEIEKLLSDKPLFVLINGYAAGYSPLAFAYNMEVFVNKYGGSIEYGDLAIAEEKGERVLPAGIFARWKA